MQPERPPNDARDTPPLDQPTTAPNPKTSTATSTPSAYGPATATPAKQWATARATSSISPLSPTTPQTPSTAPRKTCYGGTSHRGACRHRAGVTVPERWGL